MSNERLLRGSPFPRGLTETKPYRVNVAEWGAGTYSSPLVKIYDEAGEDVSSTVLTGSASFSSSYLTTPDFLASAMTAGKTYKLVVSWQLEGKTVSAYGLIEAQQ